MCGVTDVFDPWYTDNKRRRRLRIIPLRFHPGQKSWGHFFWLWRFGAPQVYSHKRKYHWSPVYESWVKVTKGAVEKAPSQEQLIANLQKHQNRYLDYPWWVLAIEPNGFCRGVEFMTLDAAEEAMKEWPETIPKNARLKLYRLGSDIAV